jgi:DNA-binding NtrC family response regulator
MTTPSILIVEDAPDLLMLYKRYFANLGATIQTAETGAKALELLGQGKPTVLVMDLTLKDMSTADFYEKFAALGIVDLSMILISGRDDLATWADLFGATKYYKKPVERDVITTAVKSFLPQA